MKDAISVEEKIGKAKASLYESALKACENDYERLKDISKTLETKAQVTITVAGVFIAAIFAFVRDISALKLNPLGVCLLVIAIILLITTVFCSIGVLLIRTTLQPMTGEQLNEAVDNMLDPIQTNTELDYKRILNFEVPFIGQQVTSWKSAINSIGTSNDSKTFFLRIAHMVLLAAMLFVCILTWGILSGGLRTAS